MNENQQPELIWSERDNRFITEAEIKDSVEKMEPDVNGPASSGMFVNVGSKIKKLSKVLLVVGVILSLVISFILWIQAGQMSASYYRDISYQNSQTSLILVGFVILFMGSFFSWIGSLFLYAFGQMVENSDKLVTMASSNTNTI